MSPRGVRQLGEVALDELVVTGMTLTAPPPQLRALSGDVAAAADELAGLGVAGANVEPEPLQVKSIRRRRIGRLVYEQMTFDHDPRLPESLAAEGFGGPATAVVQLLPAWRRPRPWLVWVHGAGQGGRSICCSPGRADQDELGFNIALPIQPGHGVRRDAVAAVSRHRSAEQCGGHDAGGLRGARGDRLAGPQSSAIAVSGVSLGSAVAALVVAARSTVDAVAVYTPILGLNAMIASTWAAGGGRCATPPSCCSPTPWRR